jgi:hypothetical protein
MPAQVISDNNDYTNILTDTHSKCNVRAVRFGDIKTRLIQTHKDAVKQLRSIHDEQNELRSAYRRYVDLESQAKFYENRIKRVSAALREHEEFENVSDSIKDGKNVSKTIGITMDAYSVPLWEIISAILETTGEVQVIELESILSFLEIDTSRSAIESALKTHKDCFQIRPSGRSKFVSLKGA